MGRFNVGIDTGGTYTDAVVIDVQSNQLLAAAKSLTTKGDLSIGIIAALTQALEQLDPDFDRGEIEVCSLSTTLATNALVEGHGSSVGVFLIGFDSAMVERTGILNFVPTTHVALIEGGHRYDGSEQQPLDEAAVAAHLETTLGGAQAFSVAAHYSVRNTGHEKRAVEIIKQMTQRPVTASHELSDHLNGPRRALTATLNAQIIGLIVDLESAVRKSLESFGIDAQIMIVKGDGSIATADTVTQRPIETILSGPAASVIGAKFLTGLQDFLVADIGGTTSDFARVEQGWPRLNQHGAEVGEFTTLVKAVDMRTAGLGGDSAVNVDDDGQVLLSNQRVIPISAIAQRWPWVINKLKVALNRSHGKREATQYLVRSSSDQNLPQDLQLKDRGFLHSLKPDTPYLVGDLVYKAADRSRVHRLTRLGLLQLSGVTPTDAAHVLKQQTGYSVEGASLGCELLGRASGLIKGTRTEASVTKIAEQIHEAVVRKSSLLVIEQLTRQRFQPDNPVIGAAINNQGPLKDLEITVKPTIPIVAVGGPASVYYPDVGQRLHTNATVPESAAVANAVGAAMAMFRIRKEIEVTLNQKGGYWIHGDEEPILLDTAQEAIDLATTLAKQAIQAESSELGSLNGETVVDLRRVDVPNIDADTSLVAATVIAEFKGQIDTLSH